MSVTRFMRGFAAFCAASILAAFAATPLNDIPGTTEVYSAAETDARIAELGGAGDYAAVSNAAVNAGWRATNYTDYAVARLSQTNSVLSGGPYQTELPYPTNAIPYSAISDAPPAVAVVAPSTNAVAGTAADAKATGTALYTGFTEWEFSGDTQSGVVYTVAITIPEAGYYIYTLYSNEGTLATVSYTTDDISMVVFNVGVDSTITATRHIITPTKTSQLVNDGNGTYPFATTNQIPAPVDISGKLDGAAAYPAWSATRVYYGGEVVSHNGGLWRYLEYEPPSEGGGGEPGTEYGGSWYSVIISGLKQDALSQSQLATVNSGVTSEKVQTWDGYAALISAKVSTNALAGQTYDFSRNYDIIRATADIVQLLGGTVTNNPTAQGGN